MKVEKRTYNVEYREKEQAESRTIVGRAAIFNSEADLGWFREKILPGAFSDALATSDVRALFNHDPNHLLARNKSNTLKLNENADGLAYEFDMPKTRDDIIEMIERGDLSQNSFAFTVKHDEWEELEDGTQLRTIHKVDQIFDISLVTYPAYEDTDLSIARSRFDAFKEQQKEPIDKVAEEARERHLYLLEIT